ncbi:hypothetical protein, partial [Mycolicibacterium porcinum]|uniref:hypothetical protein n=1 Tax=Mycolicibacterium porcinum TaxID=39693 RepID=UPI001041FD5E
MSPPLRTVVYPDAHSSLDSRGHHSPAAQGTGLSALRGGFPGETEEDFQATLDVVERSRFASAFTFQYSIRPGTPAADMP